MNTDAFRVAYPDRFLIILHVHVASDYHAHVQGRLMCRWMNDKKKVEAWLLLHILLTKVLLRGNADGDGS